MKVPHAYTPRTEPSGKPLAYLAQQSADLSGPGKGLAAVGEGLSVLGRALGEMQDEEAKTWAIKQTSDFNIEQTERLQQQQTSAASDPVGFTQQYSTWYDERSKEILQSAPSARAAEIFSRQSASRRDNAVIRAMGWEAEQRQTNDINRLREAADNFSTEVYRERFENKENLRQQRIAEYSAMIDAKALPPSVKDSLKREFREKSALAGVIPDAQHNPADAAQWSRGSVSPDYFRRMRDQEGMTYPRGYQNQSLRPISERDRDVAIRTVIGEAGAEDDASQLAVANVIVNRARAGRGGARSLEEVVFAPGQFEPWSTKRAELEAVRPDSPEYQRAAAAVDRALAGGDTTGGATHFLAPEVMAKRGQPLPAWARGAPTARVGGHAFFAPEGRVTRMALQERAAEGTNVNDLHPEFQRRLSRIISEIGRAHV